MHQHIAYSLEDWTSLVSSTFVPLTAEARRNRPFVGNLSARNFGDLAVHQINATAQTIERDCALAPADAPAFYKINFQQSGHCLLIQDGREVVLEPGGFAIFDTSRPYTLAFEEDFSTTVVMAPRALLGSGVEELSQLTAVDLGARHQLSSPVSQLMEYVGEGLNRINHGVGSRLAFTIIDLLKEVVGEKLHSTGSSPDTSPDEGQHELSTALTYIDRHLSDPELTPNRVAQALYMSLRSLHQVFEASSNTVAATIREKRLERAYADLLRPSDHDVPIAAIGARWGFHDPAYFSRLFKQKYGVSPSEVRA